MVGPVRKDQLHPDTNPPISGPYLDLGDGVAVADIGSNARGARNIVEGQVGDLAVELRGKAHADTSQSLSDYRCIHHGILARVHQDGRAHTHGHRSQQDQGHSHLQQQGKGLTNATSST